jgi:hypothetical protein
MPMMACVHTAPSVLQLDWLLVIHLMAHAGVICISHKHQHDVGDALKVPRSCHGPGAHPLPVPAAAQAH